MSLYRKERKDVIFTVSEGQSAEMSTVVPKMYGVLLAGILLLMLTVFSWAIFGTIDESVAITGLYHPGAVPEGEVVAFAPLATGKTLRPGMPVTVSLVGYETQKMGQMHGEITFVEESVTSVDDIREVLGDDTLVNVFIQRGPVVMVVCRLDEDPDSANGYAWTHRAGENIIIQDLTYSNLKVVKDTIRPITLGISGISDFLG